MRARIVLAGPAQKPGALLDQLAARIGMAGYQVDLLALDHRAPDNELEQAFLSALRAGDAAHVIGGFSLGARIATRIAGQTRAQALLLYSFPFHRRGQPAETHGRSSLVAQSVPTLIVQGARDAYGSQSAVRGQAPLPKSCHVHWLADASHQWLSRGGVGASQGAYLDEASRATLDFLRQSLVSTAS